MSTDGRLLAAVDTHVHQMVLWDVPNRKKLFTAPDTAILAAISSDGGKVAVSTNHGVRVWDTGTLVEVGQMTTYNTLSMAFSPDNRAIAIANGNNVEIHQVSDGAKLATLTGHPRSVTSVQFDRAGAQLLTASPDGMLRLWNADGWTEKKVMTMPE
ncbi:WD40 repeat domain-containing protein, partial [Kibdelosporangium lantanae]